MNKIITPLRAEQSEDEPVYSFIYDKDGKYLFTVPHRYAAAIIAMSEDAKRLDWLEKQAMFRFTRWADGTIDVYHSNNGNAVNIQPETKSYRMAIDAAIAKAPLAAGGDQE